MNEPINALREQSKKKAFFAEMKRQGRKDFAHEEDDALDRVFKGCSFKKLDILGEPVTFNFKGSTNYNTNLGACCSILLFAFLIGYASSIIAEVVDGTVLSTSGITKYDFKDTRRQVQFFPTHFDETQIEQSEGKLTKSHFAGVDFKLTFQQSGTLWKEQILEQSSLSNSQQKVETTDQDFVNITDLLNVEFEKVTTSVGGALSRQQYPLESCDSYSLCPIRDLNSWFELLESKNQSSSPYSKFEHEHSALQGQAFQTNTTAYILRIDPCTAARTQEEQCKSNSQFLNTHQVVLQIKQQLLGDDNQIESYWSTILTFKPNLDNKNDKYQARLAFSQNSKKTSDVWRSPEESQVFINLDKSQNNGGITEWPRGQPYYSKIDTSNLIVFQASQSYEEITVQKRWTLLAAFEAFGGFTFMMFGTLRFLTSLLEANMKESDILSSVYSVERENDADDEKARNEPPPLRNLPKDQDDHIAITPGDGLHNGLQKNWDENIFTFKERMANLSSTVKKGKKLKEIDLRTLQEIIISRDTIETGVLEWIRNFIGYSPLTCFGKLCCFRPQRNDEMFKKGRRKISQDLDLRTYIKAVKHVQILQNVLLNERQRTLMNFQKQKVIDSGSTSASDEYHYEAAPALRHYKTKTYLKKYHANEINRMLIDFNRTRSYGETEARLINGVVTKFPIQNDNIKTASFVTSGFDQDSDQKPKQSPSVFHQTGQSELNKMVMSGGNMQLRMAAKDRVDDEVISNLFHTLAQSKGLPTVQEEEFNQFGYPQNNFGQMKNYHAQHSNSSSNWGDDPNKLYPPTNNNTNNLRRPSIKNPFKLQNSKLSPPGTGSSMMFDSKPQSKRRDTLQVNVQDFDRKKQRNQTLQYKPRAAQINNNQESEDENYNQLQQEHQMPNNDNFSIDFNNRARNNSLISQSIAYGQPPTHQQLQHVVDHEDDLKKLNNSLQMMVLKDKRLQPTYMKEVEKYQKQKHENYDKMARQVDQLKSVSDTRDKMNGILGVLDNMRQEDQAAAKFNETISSHMNNNS